MSKNEVEVSDFEKICRLCLGSKRSLVDIFPVKKRVGSTVPIDQKILSCSSVIMVEEDGLPGKICLKCVQAVNMSYSFRLQVEKADAQLREILSRSELLISEGTSNRLEGNDCKFESDAATCYEDVNGQTQFTDEIIIEIATECPQNDVNDISAIRDYDEDTITECDINSPSNIESIAEMDEDGEDNDPKEPDAKIARYSSAAAHFALALLSKQEALTITKSDNSKQISTPKASKLKSASINDSKDEEEVSELTARRHLISRKIKELGKKMEGDKYYCQECKIFIGTAYFYNHVKFVHVKVRDHLCEDCGYRAQTGHILRQHIDALHSDHTYPCDHCERTFRSVKSARDHMRSVHIQTKERTHICQFCGKGFFTAHYLRNHIRTHTLETPYKCQFCDRRFSFKWPCTTHERLHTGVKPYKCSFCSEAFTQNCVRKNHEYRAHGNEEFNPKNRKPREGNLREKKKGKIKIVPTDLLTVSMSSETSSAAPLSF